MGADGEIELHRGGGSILPHAAHRAGHQQDVLMCNLGICKQGRVLKAEDVGVAFAGSMPPGHSVSRLGYSLFSPNFSNFACDRKWIWMDGRRDANNNRNGCAALDQERSSAVTPGNWHVGPGPTRQWSHLILIDWSHSVSRSMFQNLAEHNNSDTSESVSFWKNRWKPKKFSRNEVEPREKQKKCWNPKFGRFDRIMDQFFLKISHFWKSYWAVYAH
jgi:hypothetical protein